MNKIDEMDSNDKLILVMGMTGAGKTSFINAATGSRLAVSNSSYSCTRDVALSDPIKMDGHSIRLVDTPGYDDTSMPNAEIFSLVAQFLAKVYKDDKDRIVGAIYLQDISHVADTSSSAQAFDYFKGTVGYAISRNIWILTTHWTYPGDAGYTNDIANDQRKAHNELRGALSHFKGLVDKGATIMKYEWRRDQGINVQDVSDLPQGGAAGTDQTTGVEIEKEPESITAQGVLEAFVKMPTVRLLIQTEAIDKKMKLKDTTGGVFAHRELKDIIKDAENEVKKCKKQLKEWTKWEKKGRKLGQDERASKKIEVAKKKIEVAKKDVKRHKKIQANLDQRLQGFFEGLLH